MTETEWQEYLKATRRAQRAARYAANKELVATQQKSYREANPERKAAIQRKYRENNKSKAVEQVARRNGRIKQASALNTAATYAEMDAMYAEARRLTAETGVQHDVDHVWPIRGKHSSGLHVPWNMQVLTQPENDAKGSKEPELWWM